RRVTLLLDLPHVSSMLVGGVQHATATSLSRSQAVMALLASVPALGLLLALGARFDARGGRVGILGSLWRRSGPRVWRGGLGRSRAGPEPGGAGATRIRAAADR